MDAATAVALVDLLEDRDVDIWLDGGWGVDALLGEQQREHDDLDLVARLEHSELIVQTLTEAGFELVAGGPPKSFVLVDGEGKQVDVHPVVFDESRGGAVYVNTDGSEWVYPTQGFTGRGAIGGRLVRCLSPEAQVLVHAGYDLGEKDYRELRLLHERFGVELAPDVLRRAGA